MLCRVFAHLGGPLVPHRAPELVAKDLALLAQALLTLTRQPQAAPRGKEGSASS